MTDVERLDEIHRNFESCSWREVDPDDFKFVLTQLDVANQTITEKDAEIRRFREAIEEFVHQTNTTVRRV